MFDHLDPEEANLSPTESFFFGSSMRVVEENMLRCVKKLSAALSNIAKINRGMAGLLLSFVGPRKR